MKKKLTAILLAAAMAVTGLFTAMTPEKANAAEWEACDIPVIKDVSEFDAVSAMYSKTITVTKKDKNIEQGYGSFQLKSDSWVILKTTSSLVTSQEDGHQTHIEVFSDASASNKVLETGDGYWEYDGDQYTILKKGTYYFHTKSSCQNYDTFTGNINVVAAAIPTSKLIQTGVKKNSIEDANAYTYIEENRSNCQDELRAAVAERLGKEVEILVKLNDTGTPSGEIYPDLRQLINFEIEEDDF